MYDWNYFDDMPVHHIISDANSLYMAYKAAKKGSSWKTQVQRFEWNCLSEIRMLQKELESNTYVTSRYTEFFVNERGKTRPITGLQMRDRVVRHSLNDNVLIPATVPHLIHDNGASLKGKGIDFTRKRLIAHLIRYYRKHGSNDGYILIMDYSKFYDNIQHKKAIQMFKNYIDDTFALDLTEQIFDTYKVDVSYLTDAEFERCLDVKFDSVKYRLSNYKKTGEKYMKKSVSVGDQTSQITAVSFPTAIDKFVTVVCGYGLYARYMDDSYIIAETKEELLQLIEKIKNLSNQLGIFLNEKKTQIVKLSRTFTFLQNKYYLAENGHVVIRINSKSITRMRRKLKKLKSKVEAGKLELSKIEELFKSWIAARIEIMSKIQLNHIVDLYQNLYGHGLDEWMKQRFII